MVFPVHKTFCACAYSDCWRSDLNCSIQSERPATSTAPMTFSYGPPTITNVDILNNGANTTVIIDGSNFGSDSQNVRLISAVDGTPASVCRYEQRVSEQREHTSD